jgi:predicted metal-binding membrane protein
VLHAGNQHADSRGALAIAILLFAISAAASFAYCTSMSMPGMPMPGGWTLSPLWLRMCAQTRPRAAAAFAGTWLATMAAMMMPALMPMLWRFRRSAATRYGAQASGLAVAVGVGYFLVWSAVGVLVYACGAMVVAAALRYAPFARTLPFAAGIVVAGAGLLQFSAWKARHLAACGDACCRPGRNGAAAAQALRAALEHGMRAGLHCVCSSAGLTAASLAVGMMDWRTMVCVTAALTAERVAPHGRRVAQASGALGTAAGAALLARAAGAAFGMQL